MNEKPHTHELEFYNSYYSNLKSVHGRQPKPDPETARGVKYGDQIRRWPQLGDFSKKVRKHWWSLRSHETISVTDAEKLLGEARRACVREIVRTHDIESIAAGERDAVRQTHCDQYTAVANEIALKPWQKELTET